MPFFCCWVHSSNAISFVFNVHFYANDEFKTSIAYRASIKLRDVSKSSSSIVCGFVFRVITQETREKRAIRLGWRHSSSWNILCPFSFRQTRMFLYTSSAFDCLPLCSPALNIALRYVLTFSVNLWFFSFFYYPTHIWWRCTRSQLRVSWTCGMFGNILARLLPLISDVVLIEHLFYLIWWFPRIIWDSRQ